jgi:sulfite reductase (NADPH) flavoprotein alpha-component
VNDLSELQPLEAAPQPPGLPARPLELIPADAPFSPAQRAWLNGFFSAILTRPPAAPRGAAPTAPSVVVSILYASQTGTAEGFSRKFAKAAKARGYGATIEDLGSVGLAGLASRPLCLVIASTYGEGEAPDSAQAFAQELAEAKGEILAGVRYAVLALGDRNYPKFCQFGAFIDARLAELGAARLAERVEADADADPAYTRWRDLLWPVLPEAGSAAAEAGARAPAAEESGEDQSAWTRERPFAARLLGNRRLNAESSDKDTRHVALALGDSGLVYEPGDALGIWPRNGSVLIDRLLEVTGLEGDAPVTLDHSTLGLREVLAARLDLGRLSNALVIRFAERFADAELLRLCEPESSELMQGFLQDRDATDLFARPSAKGISAQELVEMLPRLAPRLYSISSSLLAHPGEVHLTIGVVRQTASGQVRDGIASTHLTQSIAQGATVPVYVHRNARFRLPKDAGTPVVMIGPGTGIAPFRAFLEDRGARGLTGRTWLFFGERRSQCDFLYRDELEAWLANGTLTRLDTAFSRDSGQKFYVQDRMRENAALLWSWIQDGAVLYVCGDAQRMAKDVDRALVEIFMSEGGHSEASAQLEVRHLGANGRYLRDVY